MRKILLSLLREADELISKTYLRLFEEKKSIISFMFHGIYKNKEEIDKEMVYYQQGITVSLFRKFVEFFLELGYSFISPDDILNGLDERKNQILITFDDGYFNNQLILPILREYAVPATFFISVNHIIEYKSFWSDVMYREARKRGTSVQKILGEIERFKTWKHEKIEKYLQNEIGEKAFVPLGEIDRPFTLSELKDFSKEPFVFLGNHTCNHAILTNYSTTEIKQEIIEAQKGIHSVTGVYPKAISYPNGNYSKEIIRISKESGLKLGTTVIPQKNNFPIDLQTDKVFSLGRFSLDRDNWRNGLEFSRSDMRLEAIAYKILFKTRYIKSEFAKFLDH